MIIFIYGQDTYRSHQKLKEIIEYYKKKQKSALNLAYFNEENLSFQGFKKETENYSIFREKKLIVLRGVFSNKDFQEEFLRRGKKLINSSDVILVYEGGKIEKSNVLFKFLKKESKSQELQPLEGQKLINWAKQEIKNYQEASRQKVSSGEVKIREEALGRLIDFVGNNLWQLSSEIKKLVDYKNKGTITVEDVDALVKPKIEAGIFETIDAITLRNKKQALKLLHKHLEKGDNPLYLLTMINFQLRNLLTVKSGARLSAHPFVVRKTTQQARNFSLDELKKIYQKIFQVDLGVKTGKIDPEVALDLLITST